MTASERLPRVMDLTGPWFFQPDPMDLGEREGWCGDAFDYIQCTFLRSQWKEVVVPGAYDLYDISMWSYEGVCWYAVELPAASVQPDLWQRLRFNRVSIHAKVWLNGQPVGEHLGGYLPFEIAASPSLRPNGPNRLVVRVDNARRPEWLPGGQIVEWVQYGGILQPVQLISTTPAYVSDVAIAAEPEGRGALVNVRVEITNRGAHRFEGVVAVGAIEIRETLRISVGPGATEAVRLQLLIPEARPWSPDSPVLFSAAVTLQSGGQVLDSVEERFGVRKIEVRDREILLNGRPLHLKGVNRYDEYAPYGPVVPEAIVRADLEHIKRVGCNLVRVHYPQDPLILSLMDEIGLLFMEEVPLNWWAVNWFGDPPPIDDDAVIDAAERALEDMVRRDKNHPCLIIWSMANECGTQTQVGASAMRRLMRRARELDTSRLITYVSAGDARADPAYAEADIVCNNVYYGVFGEGLAQHLADMETRVAGPTEAHLRKVCEYYADKPVLITEFGARSFVGQRGDAPYTEDHHAAWLEAAWRGISAVPGVVGGVVWSWADYYHQRAFYGHNSPTVHGPFGVVGVERAPKPVVLAALARMFDGKAG